MPALPDTSYSTLHAALQSLTNPICLHAVDIRCEIGVLLDGEGVAARTAVWALVPPSAQALGSVTLELGALLPDCVAIDVECHQVGPHLQDKFMCGS